MAFPAAQNSVVGAVPPEAIGKASGTNSTMRELGGVFGIALGVAVFAGRRRLRLARRRSATASSRAMDVDGRPVAARGGVAGWRCRAGRRCASPRLRLVAHH